MKVLFRNKDLDRLETDPNFDGGYSQPVVKAFRKKMQFIRSALDERALYAMKSLHFEALKGDRKGQHSIRLNEQWRLVVWFEGSGSDKTLVVISVEDYH